MGLLFLYGFRPDPTEATAAKAVTQLKDTLSVASIIFGIVLAGSRFLAATDASAQEFLRSRPDPLGALVRHVEHLLRLLRRPVAILVDDIDRCDIVAVVRVLEGIHTVFGTLPIVFVIAGDGRWIARAFEKTYADTAPQGVDPVYARARPLGALFLEKIFQFRPWCLRCPRHSSRGSGEAFCGRKPRPQLPTQVTPPPISVAYGPKRTSLQQSPPLIHARNQRAPRLCVMLQCAVWPSQI